MRLVTRQTGPEGKTVQRVLIEEALDRDRRALSRLVIDRTSCRTVMMASSAGNGHREVAEKTPHLILKEPIDPAAAVSAVPGAQARLRLGLTGAQIGKAAKIMANLHRAFEATDASLVEINPLVTTKGGDVLALDAKMNFDDNALYRTPTSRNCGISPKRSRLEVEASRFALNYIKLNGNVGCMVNGPVSPWPPWTYQAGGRRAANFLDVGGGATTEQVTNAFRIICPTSMSKGSSSTSRRIMRCDIVAQGVVSASASRRHGAGRGAARGNQQRGSSDPQRVGAQLHRSR